MVPRKGLEPPRSYPLVPETSASTNSATWASQATTDFIIKDTTNLTPAAGGNELLAEVEGTVQGHRDGHGFVTRDDRQPDLYLSPQEMKSVLHRDRVKARIVRYDKKGRPEGRILEILERKKAPIIGRLLHESGIWLLAPEDKRYGQDIIVPKNGIADAKAGQVVAIELMEPPSMHSQPVGRVTEVLGEIDDPGMEIEIAVRKYEVPHIFSDATLAQAEALPGTVQAADKKNRVDLTDVPLVTIDGEDARDFDDAVYCEPAQPRQVEGRQRLAPDHRDRRRQPLRAPGRADRRRRLRARDLGLLPAPRHSDAAGEALEWPVLAQPRGRAAGNGLRHARQQRRRGRGLPVLPGGDPFRRALHVHGSRGDPRQHARPRGRPAHRRWSRTCSTCTTRTARCCGHGMKRGAIDFETTETQIVCDENGRIDKIVPRTRNEAHRLIEESMLAANVCSADFIARAKHPSLYRVHEGPTPEKKTLLQNYLKALGLGLSISDDPKPSEYQAIAAATKERPDAAQIHQMLLRSMQQAIYTSKNSGHFGLAYEAYTHFTSPIRRYPDLLVHRVIKALLDSKPLCDRRARRGSAGQERRASRKAAKSAKNGQARRRPGRRSLVPGGELEAWEIAGAHCSANERRADEASRDVEAWLKCRYMREHLGEEFGGAVTAVTSFGLFVVLDGLYVEGLVHVTELGGEYFRFDEIRQELRGERSGLALRRRHARARAGEPRRPRRPQDRFPHGPRRRRRRRCCRARSRDKVVERTEAATSEIVALKQADRGAKAADEGEGTRTRAGSAAAAGARRASRPWARRRAGAAPRAARPRR